ncbi:MULTISPECIES: dTMP kinase [Paenibacillus]|uniref:Thymidylate kinase n=1 Tax=Paenibacillus odorifer TaxID=189426 RepID=A0A1R0YSC7_9BACL|nr:MULTISPECIES: dTMP kinase [Paenibacillus]AIQ71818.1 thymidylate kinase [Paenibacillus odorifer]AWV31171.1 dTMP kinase [Paenibacillus odorifer]ETT65174.1 thymidylate kinase [Paenibacillus sp. FSL H8-237]MDH6431340.1 dTMP kinase [Paenibacillus sp. PastH-4]MDH6447406.1 dTMP kinase [Paenibacillus sp. PastF-4]
MGKEGFFITLEGGEGSGKTTVLGRVAAYLQNRSMPYRITREPGGIEIAEKIRSIILDPAHTAMDARTEALLYAASRSQHLAEVVEPALREGLTVLCDRFVDSSLVYQGHARGLGMEEVWSINRFAIGNRMPDLTFYLDVDPEIGLSRIAANQDREVNRLDMESLAFHQKVREGYHLLIKANPERIVVLDANRPIHLVEQDIVRTLEERVLKGF